MAWRDSARFCNVNIKQGDMKGFNPCEWNDGYWYVYSDERAPRCIISNFNCSEIRTPEIVPADDWGCAAVWEKDSEPRSMFCVDTRRQPNCHATECLSSKSSARHDYCCCKSDGCNERYNVTEPTIDPTPAPVVSRHALEWIKHAVLIIGVVVVLISVFIAIFIYKYKSKLYSQKLPEQTVKLRSPGEANSDSSGEGRMLHHGNQHGHAQFNSEFGDPLLAQRSAHDLSLHTQTTGLTSGSPTLPANQHRERRDDAGSFLPTNTAAPARKLPRLDHPIAKGSFGKVWHAYDEVTQQYCAVKVLPSKERRSFLNEVTIYKCHEKMRNHPNILKYIDSIELGGNGLDREFWLITEFYELGSLATYLKTHTLTELEFGQLALAITSGLSFLHEDSINKVVIAHQDFKGGNILVKKITENGVEKMSAAISDYGLARRFLPGQASKNNQTQIGTRRYMAPELLEGAISFYFESILRVDIYAFALVLWEMLGRCVFDKHKTGKGYSPSEFTVAFQQELGMNPALEDMFNFVVVRRLRPQFLDLWKNGLGNVWARYCQTIEECWDHDADARLSAGCIQQRFEKLLREIEKSTTVQESA